MSLPPEFHPEAPSPQPVAGIVLAAGESSRMGEDKALLMYRGRTFLENINSVLREAGIHPIIVVLGHHAELIRQRVDLRSVEVIVNQDYRSGQTSSLQAGLRVLAGNEPDGVLLCLTDHPVLSADTINKLIHNFTSTGRPVVIPQINGKHGHPVLLGRGLFNRILALGPDEGADTVIHQYRDRTEFVEVTDAGILIDVDDPESYRKLMAQE
ncbi:MAG TPA: nucleotidyltransferase family protein [Terriglobia bacterium]|nr:nucleotidyltransferase family protein [Terriglobia bacterium]